MAEIGVYVCSHVFEDTRPVLLVAREDGDWQYLCGQPHPDDEEYHLIGVNHLVERDGSLRETFDLPDNYEAERATPDSPWVRVAIGTPPQP